MSSSILTSSRYGSCYLRHGCWNCHFHSLLSPQAAHHHSRPSSKTMHLFRWEKKTVKKRRKNSEFDEDVMETSGNGDGV
ncbi:hypothetical protein Tco_0717360 [Tanacetum coccineum]